MKSFNAGYSQQTADAVERQFNTPYTEQGTGAPPKRKYEEDEEFALPPMPDLETSATQSNLLGPNARLGVFRTPGESSESSTRHKKGIDNPYGFM